MLSEDCTALGTNTTEYKLCMANQGDPSAQYDIGLAAYQQEDYQTALKWFTKAAEPRRDNSNLLEVMDEQQARKTAIPAKKERIFPGHNGARRLLIRMYEQGLGVEIDQEKADYYKNM